MGKKKEEGFYLAGKKIDNKELLLNIIETLQKFCDDNILALKPLLDDVEDNDAIKERIIHFITISDILDSIEQLTTIDIPEEPAPKKKTAKKKK